MFEVYFIYLFGQYVMCLHVCEYVYVCGFSQKKKKVCVVNIFVCKLFVIISNWHSLKVWKAMYKANNDVRC